MQVPLSSVLLSSVLVSMHMYGIVIDTDAKSAHLVMSLIGLNTSIHVSRAPTDVMKAVEYHCSQQRKLLKLSFVLRLISSYKM